MPRARGTKQYQPLTQGLITEASPLDFPQGGTLDEINFVHESKDNKRVKRKGLEPILDLNWDVSSIVNDLDMEMAPTELFWWDSPRVWLLVVSGKKTVLAEQARELVVLVYNEFGTLLGNFNLSRPLSVRVEDNTLLSRVTEVGEDTVIVGFNGTGSVMLLQYEFESTTASPKGIQGYQVFIEYRDFTVLQSDTAAAGRKAQPASGAVDNNVIDNNYEYNIANAGWIRESLPLQSASGAKKTMLQHIRDLGAGNYYPSMYESPNSYIVIDSNTRVFDRTSYTNSASSYSGQAAVGSQIDTADNPERNFSTSTKPRDSLTELNRIDL